MSMIDIILTALFCFSTVFALLGCLFILVKLSTSAIRVIELKLKDEGR